MGTQGLFGYILNGKLRMMHIQFDANMLWDILIREIYVIMLHYNTIKEVKKRFSLIQKAKGTPLHSSIEKCKYFTDLSVSYKSTSDWYCLLRGCQSSFINLLEAGYILNSDHKSGYVFIWDLDTNSVEYTFHYDYDKPVKHIKKESIENIMNTIRINNPPTKTYTEIVADVKDKYEKKISDKKMTEEKIVQLKNEIKTITDFQKIKWNSNVDHVKETVDILLQLKNHDLQLDQFKIEQFDNSSSMFSNRLMLLGMCN